MYFSDSPEWRYLFKNAIDWKEILALYPQTDAGTCEEVLSAVSDWCRDSVGPRARELDRVGGGTLERGRVLLSEPLKATYQEALELGVFGVCIDSRYGGMGLPSLMGLLVFQQLARSCIATSTQVGFFISIADMVERFLPGTTASRLLPLIREGHVSGSMCMTEPQAGSDLGAIRASARRQADGTYLLNGTKCFITNAGGGLGFVLARVEGAPAGLDGISIFLAEDGGGEEPNYRVTKIEEKLGMHGSPTCEVVYENTVARLVGREGEGFRIMLHLMNEARISVGLQGLAGMEAALAAARAYAETRVQFGKPIIELPLLARHFSDWETERDAFRALMVDTLSHFEVFQRLDLKKRHAGELTQAETERFKRASHVVRLRTPLAKYYGAEAYAQISQRAIQVFGGYGFMTEYDVERIHRDCFGPLLYEGTSQVQALMVTKDFAKSLLNDVAGYAQALMSSHPRREQFEFRRNAAALLLRHRKDSDRLMTHAETLCQALCYIETLGVLAKHARGDPARTGLLERYRRLVRPRLSAIYADWRG